MDLPNTTLLPEMRATPTLLVRRYGDPVLRKKAVEVGQITAEVREFADRMIAAMFADDGIGLAAPQVGRSIRLIALATNSSTAALPDDASAGERLLWGRMPLALVNPRVASCSEHRATVEEGCLSLPGIYGSVQRPVSIVLQTTLLSGETLTVECGGLLGRCLQHEIDHLDGILFTDRLAPDDAQAVEPQMAALKKETKRNLKRRH